MPATPLSPTTRYQLRGKRQWYWVPTIVDKNAPTRAELNAGTDLSGEIAPDGVEGFDLTTEDIETPDLASVYNSKVPGVSSSSDSALTFYADTDSDDIRGVLVAGTNGHVVQFPEGDDETVGTTRTMNVFPSRIKPHSYGNDVGNAGQITVGFSITSEPAMGVTVPAGP